MPDADTTPIRWGCVGTGNIAMSMAQQLSRLPDACRELLCSASGKSADAIEAQRVKYGYARTASSVEELVADPRVDVVYVASSNTAHAAHCLLALRAGKPVLCEKPLTMTAAELEEVCGEAQRRGLLFVDGTFSAYLPGCAALRASLAAVGRVSEVRLNKKIRLSIMRGSPVINKRAMGGGLFDGCGSYTAHALVVVFGAAAVAALRPVDLDVVSTAGPAGVGEEVDWDTTVTVRICDAVAVLTHRAADDAWQSVVRGERGLLEFDLPRLARVSLDGAPMQVTYTGAPDAADLPADEPGAPHGLHTGLGVEAHAVHCALRAGATGPGLAQLPLEEMRAVAHLMDLVRQRLPTHLHYKPGVA